MSWLTKAFEEHTIEWLLISAVVSLIAGFVASWLTYHFKRREIIDTAMADIKKQQNIVRIETEKEREERIRIEIVKWANPILAALRDLKSRLNNILDRSGYLALTADYKSQINPNWSISYDYFMSSTLFIFSQYLAWVQMLQEKLNFELFQSQQSQKEFFDAVYAVSSSLSAFPPHNYVCSGKDTQVFYLQQRAIGEMLIVREKDSWMCMGYPEFLERLKDSQSILNQHLQPLRILLDNLTPKDDCRWKRLDVTRQALSKLETVCEKLLSLPKKLQY